MVYCCVAVANTRVAAVGKDEVYVASVALRGTKGPAQLLMSAAYSLHFWDLQHFMVIVKPSPPPPHNSHQDQDQAVVFDFQPKDPECICTALAVLSGRSVPGAVLVRRLTKLPRGRCWFVGCSTMDAIDVATKFSDSWETDLRVGYHDCRHYTNGLVELLVGEKDILEHLKRDTSSQGRASNHED